MKKLAILFVFIFATASLTSCKSQKGCGLTGDTDAKSTNPIEKVSTVDSSVVA